eukprot:6491074-Amphidinium_carterae.2
MTGVLPSLVLIEDDCMTCTHHVGYRDQSLANLTAPASELPGRAIGSMAHKFHTAPILDMLPSGGVVHSATHAISFDRISLAHRWGYRCDPSPTVDAKLHRGIGGAIARNCLQR